MGHFYLYIYESARTLILATIIARLDYCNILLYGSADGQIKMLQRLQNMAARLVTCLFRITLLMFKLPWLPVKLIIKYKILSMTYRAMHGLSPDYIQSLVQVKKKSPCNLRSNDKVLLVPSTFKSNKATWDRAFQVAAPFEWNKLPKSLRLGKDLKSFKTKLIIRHFYFKKLINFFTFLLSPIYDYWFYILLTTVNIIIIHAWFMIFLNIANTLIDNFKRLRSFIYGSCAI